MYAGVTPLLIDNTTNLISAVNNASPNLVIDLDPSVVFNVTEILSVAAKNVSIYGHGAVLHCFPANSIVLFYVTGSLLLDSVTIMPTCFNGGYADAGGAVDIRNTTLSPGFTGFAAGSGGSSVAITNCAFEISTSYGLSLTDGASGTVINSTFNIPTATAAIDVQDSSIVIRSSHFDFGEFAIYLQRSLNSSILGCSFDNYYGVAITSIVSQLTVVESNFSFCARAVESTLGSLQISGGRVDPRLNSTGLAIAVSSQRDTLLSIDGLVFTGQSGNVISVSAATQVSLRALLISDIYSELKGVVVQITNVGAADITDCAFVNNTAASGDGGALWIYNSQNVTVTNCVIANNTAQRGGAIYSENTDLRLHDCDLEGNRVNISGGAVLAVNSTVSLLRTDVVRHDASAIFAFSGSLQILSSTFRENTGDNGGAVFANGTHIESVNSTFEFNYAPNGGAMFVTGSSSVTLSKNTFQNNSADLNGGALVVEHSTLFSSENTFEHNAASAGGALHLFDTYANHTSDKALNNTADIDGGAFFVSSGSVDMTSCVLTNNKGQNGGALYATMPNNSTGMLRLYDFTCFENTGDFGGCLNIDRIANFSMESSRVYGNTAVFYGGGVMISKTRALLNLSNIEENNAVYGAGIWNSGALSVSYCTVSGNQAMGAGTGAGIYTIDVNSVTQIYYSTVSNNYASSSGGGLSFQNSNGLNFILNSSISANTATFGGGVHAFSSNVELRRSSITANKAQQGGGFYIEAQETNTLIVVLNSTITQNLALQDDALYVENQYRYSTYVRGSLVSSFNHTLASNYCCGAITLGNPSSLVCNFPACNSSCGGASGCSCPISYNTTGRNMSSIVDTVYNNTCSCADGLFGSICNGDACAYFANCPNSASECYVVSGNVTGCKCKTGYTGDGTTCNDANECALQTDDCNDNAACTNVIGSYNCTCRTGYFGNGFGPTGCVAIPNCGDGICRPEQNENCTTCPSDCSCVTCNVNNGGCDYHTLCVQQGSQVQCGNCPAEFVPGLGNSTCTPLCGNSLCDLAVGENCVTCPKDCNETTCGVCGDNQCDAATETCTNCPGDCGPCIIPQCPTCARGSCDTSKGLCVCDKDYSGPLCDVLTQAIQVNPNSTYPGLNIRPATGADVTFRISLRTIAEINFQGIALSPVSVQDLQFTLSNSTESEASAVYNYTAVLLNKAVLVVTYTQLKQGQTLFFNGKSTYYPPNTVKLGVKISKWPFKSLANTLSLELENAANSGNAAVCEQHTNHTLQWVKVYVNDVAVYVQFESSAAMDNRSRPITFSFRNQSVVASVPHFWDSMEIESTYAILVNSGGCKSQSPISGKKSKNNNTVIIACVVSIVGAALLLGGAVVGYRMYKSRSAKRNTDVPMSNISN